MLNKTIIEKIDKHYKDIENLIWERSNEEFLKMVKQQENKTLLEIQINLNAALSRISKLEEIVEASKYVYETKLVKKGE